MQKHLFLSALDMSFAASCVILFVLAARLVLKMAPKVFSYTLWAVVLFRLLCPVSFHTGIGLLPARNAPILQDILYEQAPSFHTGTGTQTGIARPSPDNGRTAPDTSDESLRPLSAWSIPASRLWAAGIFILVLCSAVQFVRLKKKLAGSTPYKDNIYLADHINAPFVMGLFRPKIYLPSFLSEQEMEYITAHEMHHIKRLDHVTRLLGFAAFTIHWFNPLVWLAFILSGRDMEMSCDEAVMNRMEHDIRAEYSQSLLRFATGRKTLPAMPPAFGAGDTKGRIKHVMKYKKPVLGAVIALTVFVSILLVMFGTDNADGWISSKGHAPLSEENIPGEADPELTGSPAHTDTEETAEKLSYDEAVRSALLYELGYSYLEGEYKAEGHIILGYDDSDKNITRIYALTMVGWYGFENGRFVKVSGSGMIPAVVTLDPKNHIDLEFPSDGGDYQKSVMNMFPGEYHERIFEQAGQDHDNLKKQEEQYAKDYLKTINRKAEIGDTPDFEYVLLTDAGVSAELSNELNEKFFKEHFYYPSYIGTRERIEDAIRMVYEMSYDENKHEIYFTKYRYDTKEIVEAFEIDAKTGNITYPPKG